MKRKKKKKPISAEQIARMASRGEDISRFFTNRLGMVDPTRRVTVDFFGPMLAEIDAVSKKLNISSEAFLKTLVREGLDLRRTRHLTPQPASIHSRSIKHLRRTSGKNRSR